MADWSLLDREWLPAPPPAIYDPYQYADYDPYYQEIPQQQLQPTLSQHPQPTQQGQPYLSPPSPTLTLLLASPRHLSPPVPMPIPLPYMPPIPRGDNPRMIRNKAEKQRRDKLNHSIAELASMVPPVVAASRKIDKTGVLRLTAHYLRAHQYVFGDSIGHAAQFTSSSTRALLGFLNGFLLTTTYKGLIVVVSQNVSEYLGYTELDLLGQNIFNLTHEDDRQMLRDQLMPRSQQLGTNGELLMPEEADGKQKVAQALANEKRRFIVRFKKLGQRSEPSKYVTCHVEGSLRKSDRACRGYNRCCQMVRRARTRGDNPCSSGNDVVFIGVVRPTTETFINESAMESYKMEYRTRHSIDGEIIQCEQRIALVTGYMTDEVQGVNAMNFIHRDEVRWVIIALREMYVNNLLFGESCYRLMTKNGQFVYMSTRGRLDVDKESHAVTSFVCTNTVVNEDEGKQLIKLMKERFTISDNNNEDALMIEDTKDTTDSQAVSIEDPKQLEKVILRLVTNLPTAGAEPSASSVHPPPRLSIIPPCKERILSAIDKIYTVFKTLHKQLSSFHNTTEPNASNSNDYSQAAVPALPFDETYILNETTKYNPGAFIYLSDDDSVVPFNEEEIKIDILPLQENYQNMLESVPGSSAAGVKRMNRDQDEGTSTKKKMVNELGAIEENSRMSPNLETFFDEAILNTQIESAIDSLEHTIDPSFPDLLISNEVQEILGKIEDPDEAIDT